MTDRSRVVNHPNHPTQGLRIESGRSDSWSDCRSVPGVGIRTNFLALSDRRPSRGPKFWLVRPRAEPSRIVQLSENRSARLSARLPSTFSDKFGQSDSRIPENIGAFFRRNLGFFSDFFKNYYSLTTDLVSFCLSRLLLTEEYLYFIKKNTKDIALLQFLF